MYADHMAKDGRSKADAKVVRELARVEKQYEAYERLNSTAAVGLQALVTSEPLIDTALNPIALVIRTDA
jgi:3-hydroxy-3-methylglutaryl CoA synthase